jgi:hypothetical protein
LKVTSGSNAIPDRNEAEIGAAFGDAAGRVDEQPARMLQQRANRTQEQRILKTSSAILTPAFVSKAQYLLFFCDPRQ